MKMKMTDANDPRAPHRIGADGARRVAVAFARAVVQTGRGEPASADDGDAHRGHREVEDDG